MHNMVPQADKKNSEVSDRVLSAELFKVCQEHRVGVRSEASVHAAQ